MPICVKKVILSFGFLSVFFMVRPVIAQDFALQHWYFGNNNQAVEFTRPNDVPVLITGYKQPPFNITGKGNATANQPETGDLLFYTDGIDIYDASFVKMNGATTTTLQADPQKNQSVAISPVPGNNDRYYIFTNTAASGIQFSEIDMADPGNATLLQPPLGTAIQMNNAIANSTATPADGMLAIANDANNGYYLITLDQGSNTYKVLTIDNSTPASWSEAVVNLGAVMDAAHITFNADSSKIAVAPKSANVNIQLLDIDLATGTLSFDKEIPNSGVSNVGATGEAIFDVAFSNDGSKLYYSIFGNGAGTTGNLMQFDLVDTTIVLSPQSVIPSPVFGSYGLQKGPDGNLYHLYQETSSGPFLIGMLTDIDSVAALTTYTPAIENGTNFNSLQFPALLPTRPPVFNSLTFTTAGNCANAPTTFYPQVSPAPNSIQWDFGDGNTSTDFAPFYTYTTAGTYTVTMRANLNGQARTFNMPVTINDFQAQLTLPQDTVACQCELPQYGPTCTPFSVTVQVQNDPGNLTYAWSNGDMGKTLTPDSAGYYYVVATDPGTGCSTYAGVQVQEYDTTIPGIAPSQRANVWYFGNQAGIDFNPPATNALTDGQMNAMEGCTAVSDRNGEIIFYTDGDVIYDQTHTQIDSGLGGTPNATGPAAQSVIAVAVPGDETLFYIFTTENNIGSTGTSYHFSYSLFDLKANNGKGAVVEKNVLLFARSTERITASNNWVIIHEYGNNNFRAYPISATGIGTPVVSSVGKEYLFTAPENGKGYMKLNGSLLGLAVVETLNGTTTSYLDVFDFNAANGQVSNLRRADLTAAGATGNAYGIEFSGPKILVSIANGASSQIMEYWLDFNDSLNLSMPIISPGIEVGAIQTGPDGQVYVAENGSPALGTINVIADTLQASTYNASSFNLAGKTSRLGLPNFIQQNGTAGSTGSITVSSPVCIGQPVYITATTTSSIDSVEWQISDPSGNIVFTSTNLQDTLTLSTSGDHSVALLIKNRCINPVGTFNEIITVSPPPQTSDLPTNTFLCGASATLPVYNTPPSNIADLDFAWNTGETTPSITVTTSGNYNVIITDRTSGCTTTAATFVGPPLPIDVGPDQTICENDPLILDSQVNADTYVWTINGLAQPGTRSFDVGAQNLAAGTYTIQVDATINLGGSIGSCTVTDQVIITVNAAPVFTAVEGAPASCGSPDGTIDITTITTPGSFTYDVAGVSGTITDTTPLPFNIPGIPAGTNALTFTNNVTGCRQTINVVVTNPTNFSITAATATDESCAGGDGRVDYTVTVNSGSLGSFTATLRDVNNAGTTFTGTGTGAGNFTINNLPASTYTLEIQEDATPNCIATWIGNPATSPPVAQNLVIGTPALSDLTIGANPILQCGTSLDFTPFVTSLTTGTNLEWSLDNFATAGNPLSQAYTSLGSNTVSFRASATTGPPVTCENIQQVNVVLTPTPTLSIDEDRSNICNGIVTLTAQGNGGYNGANLGYIWSTGETTQSITVSITGTNTYSVTASHTINQSCNQTEAINVTIPAAFTVSVSSSLACDDGQPFTLTANVNGGSGNQALTYKWLLNNSELVQTGSTITALDEGLYKAEVIDTGSGCSQADSIVINRIPLTPSNLSSAPVFCPDDSLLTLDAGPNFVSYLWSTGETTQAIQLAIGGLYTFEGTNSFGCVTEDQSNAVEDCIPVVSGPNAFKPGGVNSTYSLFTKYVDTFEIFIYNRWGELVYNSSDPAFAWDGTLNGEPLPAGQYSWVVRYTSSFRDRGTIEKYGGVVLLR